MERKHIYVIDTLLLVGTFFAVIFIFYFASPKLINPPSGLTTTGAVLFSFEKGNAILIDDNPQFTSPEKIYVQDNLIINLKQGVYYWKVEGALQSEVRELTVQSELDLKIRKSDDKYELINAGNERLQVDIYEFGKLTGRAIVDVDKSVNVSGTKFIGRKDE